MKKTKLFLFSIFTFINLIFGVNFATAQTISVEAESGTFNRGASSQGCGSCSGGNHVGNLGGLSSTAPNGYLASTVTVSSAGTYTLSLYASSGVSRSIFVGVNGNIGTEVVVNSGDWSTPAMYQTVLTLSQGTNTIKFYNDISYAPSVDKFDLTLLSATPCTDCYGPFEAEAGVVNAPATIGSCSTCSGGQHVTDLGFSDRFFNYTLPNISTAGTYRLYLSYISGSDRSLTVTVNGTTDYTAVYNSIDWNVVSVKEIDVVLPAGVNTLKFHNTTSDWAPNVDKFRLELIATTNIGSVTQTQCGGTYTWPVNNVTYSASTTETVISGNNIATLNLTINTPTTNGSVTHVQTGGNYFWAANGQTYTTSGVYTHIVDCNTATLDLTLLPVVNCADCYGPFEAESGVITSPATVGNCSTCSGGQHVTDLGFSDRFFNYTLPNISTAGTYRLYLSYISGSDRSLTVTVNGTTDYTAVYNSIDWNVVSVKEIDVVLPAGVNTLKFHNTTSDWAPNVDKFRLELIATTNIGSVTQTQCGGTYTWPVNNVTYSASTTETVISGNNIATLNLTINTPTTNGSVTHVQTGGNYFWAANGQTYTTSGVYTHIVDCNTATLDLTLLPVVNCADCYGPFEAENGVIFAPAQISNCDNCSGGKHVTDMGFSDRYFTYDVNVSKPGTYKMFISYISGEPRDLTVTVNGNSNVSSTLNSSNWSTIDVKEIEITLLSGLNTLKFHNPGNWAPNIDKFSLELETQIPDTFAPFCKGATVATATGSSTMKFYDSQTSLTALLSTTVLANAKTLWVSEVINSIESPRESRLITVTNLPSTPASIVTTDAVLCKHIGTTNEVTYTLATPNVPVSSYAWTLPSGVNAIGATNGISITVNFLGANTSVGVIGTISARALTSVETGSCASAPRSLVLSSKLPTAPTSLTLTSEDSTPHFNVITTPAVIGVSPAIYSTVGLNYLTKITKVGPYMGTSTVFTLTAPPAPTAASYAWTLPAGVNQLSGGNGNVITIDFAGVTPGIGSLPIVVKSVGGCGQSSARTLTLARALPTAPTALVVTDDAISTTTAITKVSAYTGKTTPLTLKATPAMVQGATATSYAWILPAGVNIVSPETTTPTTVQQSVNTGNFTPEGAPIFETQNFAAISTGTVSTITVNFAGVVPGTLSFPLTVFAVNGAGNSKARTRTVSAAAPTSPAITAVSGTTFNSCTPETYTVVQTLGTSYAWTIPAGATASSLTGNTIVVDYTNVVASVGATVQVTCTASNGTGSSTAKALNVKRVLCPVRLSGSSASAFSAKAYPNPSSSEFTIETSAKGAMSVKVYDMQGRLVEKADTNRVGSKLAAGTYNVIVNQGANTKSVRVIKN